MKRLRTKLSEPGPLALWGLLILTVVHLAPWDIPFTTRLWGRHGNVLSQHNTLRWQWDALWELRWNEWLSLPSFAPFESGLQFTEPLVGIAVLFAPVSGLGTVPAFNTAVMASFLLVGISMYLAGRELFEHPAAGVAAAATTMFCTWRVEAITTLNILSPYFALLGFVFLLRWLRTPRWPHVMMAALLSYLQLISVPQIGVVALYTSGVFLVVHWGARRLPVNPVRARQLVVTGTIFAVACVPWALFFRPADAAARGLLRTESMEYYRLPLAQLASTMGLTGWVMVLALVGLFGAVVRTGRDNRVGLLMGALVAGAGLLFLVALGPYHRDGQTLHVMPGLFAFRHLPFLDAYRVPGRLAQLTPLWVGLFAGGGWGWLAQAFQRRLRTPILRVTCLLPLACYFAWPEVSHETIAPITERPRDMEIARTLSQLPEDAVIAPLPVTVHHSTAAHVEEWVHEHRRPQLGGEKSRIPQLLQHAHYMLGQWPWRGHRPLGMMGMTHVVTPRNWSTSPNLTSHANALGYRVVGSTPRWNVWSVPAPADREQQPPTWSWFVPAKAVTDAGMTAALFEDGRTHAVLDGHAHAVARWEHQGVRTTVDAFVFTATFPSASEPHRLHIPTPQSPGRYTLELRYREQLWRGPVEVAVGLSTRTAPIRGAHLIVEDRPPHVRRCEFYGLRIRVHAPVDGPHLLATSIEDVPDSRGATALRYRYVPVGGGRAERKKAMPFHGHHTLPYDLAPGEAASTTWYLEAPSIPGVFDLEVQLEAYETLGKKMPWVRVVEALTVR